MTGVYHTILKFPEFGPDIYLTEQVQLFEHLDTNRDNRISLEEFGFFMTQPEELLQASAETQIVAKCLRVRVQLIGHARNNM